MDSSMKYLTTVYSSSLRMLLIMISELPSTLILQTFIKTNAS